MARSASGETINARLLETLDAATQPWGVKVTRVELRKIEPPAELVRAMNLQMTAERERRAMVARAQGEREADVARAEGRKQAAVLDAEARLAAADRDAQARERLAAAEAEATRLVSDSASGAGVGGAALLHRPALRRSVRQAGGEPIGADPDRADGIGVAGRQHRAGDRGDAHGRRLPGRGHPKPTSTHRPRDRSAQSGAGHPRLGQNEHYRPDLAGCRPGGLLRRSCSPPAST